MAISLLESDTYWIVRLEGEITGQQLLEAACQIGEREAALPVTYSRLVDLSRATAVNLNFSVLAELSKVRELAKLKNPIKSAIWASNPVQYGFARMYQTLSQNPNLEVQVFNDLESADAWLKSAVPATV
jgi:hypothetical protein